MTLSIVTGAPGWLGTRLVHSLIHGVADIPPDAPAGGPTPRKTRCLVLPSISPLSLSARDTVCRETPAVRATSLIVTRLLT